MSAPPYTTALGLSASITRARIWREVLEFVRLPLPLLRVGRGRFFDRNIWPDFRAFRIQRQPFLKPRLGVRLDRVDRAFRHADPAIDAFVRVDDEHVLALVEAVHGAHVDAVHDFAANTTLVDDEGQSSVLSADRSGELISMVLVCPRGARSPFFEPIFWARIKLLHAPRMSTFDIAVRPLPASAISIGRKLQLSIN